MTGFRLTMIAVPAALMLAACGSEDLTDGGEAPAAAETSQVQQELSPFKPLNRCVVTGCSSQVCSDRPVATTCEWRPEYACYADATCERQADGKCGWTMDTELTTCLADAGTGPIIVAPIDPVPVNPCMVTGCSGQVCANQPVATTCEWRPEYACYANAACELQARGICGWTMTDELRKCLENGGAVIK